MAKTTVNDLPNELLVCIVHHLQGPDLRAISVTNRRLLHIAIQKVWQRLDMSDLSAPLLLRIHQTLTSPHATMPYGSLVRDLRIVLDSYARVNPLHHPDRCLDWVRAVVPLCPNLRCISLAVNAAPLATRKSLPTEREVACMLGSARLADLEVVTYRRGECVVTERTLVMLARRSRNLGRVALVGPVFTDRGMTAVFRAVGAALREVVLHGVNGCTGRTLGVLTRRCVRLEMLDMQWTVGFEDGFDAEEEALDVEDWYNDEDANDDGHNIQMLDTSVLPTTYSLKHLILRQRNGLPSPHPHPSLHSTSSLCRLLSASATTLRTLHLDQDFSSTAMLRALRPHLAGLDALRLGFGLVRDSWDDECDDALVLQALRLSKWAIAETMAAMPRLVSLHVFEVNYICVRERWPERWEAFFGGNGKWLRCGGTTDV